MSTFEEEYAEFLVEMEHEARLTAMTQEAKDEAIKLDAHLIVEIIAGGFTSPK